jgi:hypothetical protein
MTEFDEKAPFVKLKNVSPCCKGVGLSVIKATSPVGVPLVAVTDPLMVIGVPWVNEVEDGVKVVVVAANFTLGQSPTRTLASMEPNPVARLYPAAAL